ncbi:S41 family peptidase [Geomesophilobacter sediminis]|uniref:PDZ domain-containing protein n=1 Tax=Geomesophilobacter sediminis TaxID=2798584 RepID=A0A8J7JMK1_9BACT|nr:PDZ domain-containing protein [Geomesophilobacter sediminis]MBJ6725915.1 PDZ domain-containing protein [Geomesophilobacter sediminis]
MMKLCMALLLLLLSVSPGFGGNSEINFGGVGIDGTPRADGTIVVKQLVLGGPAQLAGVRVGDIITHIDGKPTLGSDFNQMVQRRLRGRAGTKVMLKITRAGVAKPITLTLTRRQLALPAGRTKARTKEE